MTFRPPHPTAQNSITTNQNQSSGARPVRGQQSAWGLPAPGTGTGSRRGLTPLSTNLSSSSIDSGRTRNTASSSPFTSTFSSIVNSSTQNDSTRNGHSSSFSSSPFSLVQTGSQQPQPGQLLSSPRSRAITPSSNSHSASSAAASTTASQAGLGGSSGGGGTLRNLTFSPPLPQHSLSSPTNNSFDRSTFSGSNPSSAASGQSSVSKIVTAQIIILLGSITEKEGKAKWKTQAEAIRKLIESNGMDLFAKYFRRLLVGNSPQIFPGINRNVENPGNYQMLVQEMEKITSDPEQASRIAETIDNSEGDIFRDFDLSTFMNHFKLNAYAKTLLASAFCRVSRQDLKTKAGAILANNFSHLLENLGNARNDDPEVLPSLLASCALKYIEDVPEAFKTDNDVAKLKFSLNHRYAKLRSALPPDVQSAMLLLNLLESDHHLVKEIQLRGPQATASLEAAKTLLSEHSDESLDEMQVSRALLFMILTPHWHEYDPGTFLLAVHEYIERPFNWQRVLKGFDCKGFEMSKDKFLVIFQALLPIAKEDSQFDIQALWGGRWTNQDTQLSFIRSFVSCSGAELDATTIPRLRQAYDPRDSLDGPKDINALVEKAQRDSMISLDAVTAIIDLLVPPDQSPSPENAAYLSELLGGKVAFFLCSAAGIPKPWSGGHQNLIKQMLGSFLHKDQVECSFVLHTLWKQDKSWVAMCLIDAHREDPMELLVILELARELGWMDDLLTLPNGFGIDLAALAYRKDYHSFDQWLENKTLEGPNGLAIGISKFLVLKAQDELRITRDEQPQPRTVGLSMKTVYEMLAILDEHMTDRLELKALQRQCLQAYPRLILYCESIHDNVDVDCTESNRLPRAADAQMQELYKRMYSGELTVPNILEDLRECKESDDPARVDLFACMIHGLFDEFSCFSEYPLGPLATTAVLFGGIMHVRLISSLTLRVGQEMVLDSVRDFPPEASMYKFGLQALIHVVERLREPEWADYCAKLVNVPGLRGTQAYSTALEALNQNGTHSDPDEPNGVNGIPNGLELTNGEVDEFLPPDSNMQQFKSVNAESAATYDEPDEAIQERVVFFFNNVSEQNLNGKIGQLEGAVNESYQHWFARSLVEERAKVEPNYQPLYLEMLRLLGNKNLWDEVLRETYVSVQRLLNAESTLQSTTERKNLRNLSVWLGSLTLARDKPIKHKNVSFSELLIEGFRMQKLLLVIPFTCNVLAQGTKSVVFKPPNPWVVEIIAALMGLYKEADIKLNQKFEIEVLLKEFGLNTDSIPPSLNLHEAPYHDEDLSNVMLPDGLEGFDDLSLGSINRGVRNPRFDVDTMSSALPELETLLVFPPASGSAANQARLRQIVQEAVRRAILEIIAPVVERSVTIATIATSALIHKDFATESDEDRVRRSAQQMARQLSGSLALVTCKEPLKMSMTNYIRMAQQDLPEQVFAEGAILMCVNDNLDMACNIVEKQAEDRSMPEIESHIETEIEQRRQHRTEHPNEPFRGESLTRYSGLIPDPYKMVPGGLNPEQMAIYLDFARQSRGPTSHSQTLSTDSGRQLPDVLQDAFSSMPSIHTPAQNMATPQQPSHQQQRHESGRMLPPPIPNSIAQSQTNGFLDIRMVEERVQDLTDEIRRIVQENAESTTDSKHDGALVDALNQIWDIVSSSPDSVAMNCAENICKALYGESMLPQEIEIFVQLLSKLFETYPDIRKEVTDWAQAQNQDNEKLLLTDVTFPLIKNDILQLRTVDASLTRLIYERGEVAIIFMSELLDAVLLNDHPSALRADFASSLGAIGQLHAENPGVVGLRGLVQKLKEWGVDEALESTPDERGFIKKLQLHHVFLEWIRLCELYPQTPCERKFAAFVSQLHLKHLINSQEDMVVFLRLCINEAIDSHDLLDPISKEVPSKAFSKVDWLARLIVVLVGSQGEVNGTARGNKAAYMDSLLSLIILVMNNHHVERGEHFNQRIFFRLFSSILCDWHDFAREGHAQDRDMLLVFADNFLTLSPRHFPAFTFSWLTLISHRFFMSSLLKLPHDEGCESYGRIMDTALTYISLFLKPGALQTLAADLYRAVLRIILILHHDFPEFLAENHFTLCNAIPVQCTQLHNLVLSAYPSSFPELPNPFVTGLKVDRLEEIRKAPRLAEDYMIPLHSGNVNETLNTILRSTNISSDMVSQLSDAMYPPNNSGRIIDSMLIHSIVLYIGQSAIAAAGQKGGQPFTTDSPQATLMTKLARELQSDARYHFICAIVNQLRYPNSHTHYFSYALLHIYGTESNHDPEVRLQITKVLLERLHVVKPHPWGLVITMLELLKNVDYTFWQQPFVKASPAIQAMCDDLLKTGEERERWPSGQFAAQHI